MNARHGAWDVLGLQRTGGGTGAPLCNIANAVCVLEHDPVFKGCVVYDEFLQRLQVRMPTGELREWTDDVSVHAAHYAQDNLGLSGMKPLTMQQAAVVVGHRHTRNCVREWLDKLAWDREERLNDFVADGFGADKTAYTQAVGRNFFMSIVARVYRPGCKVDTMFVVEGRQGMKKSSAFHTIADPWFAEVSESPTKKDFYLALQGKLVVEVAEMDAFSRAEVSQVKRVLSCRDDRYRAPYDKNARDWPRQGVFVGTTNRDDWQRDETGGRRFWPIRCSAVNLDYIAAAREQLFAEAVVRFQAGATWWDMPDDETAAEQDARQPEDPWDELIEKYVSGLTPTFIEGSAVHRVTSADVLLHGLRFEAARIDGGAQKRVAARLRRLGFERKRHRVGNDVTWAWRRPAAATGATEGYSK